MQRIRIGVNVRFKRVELWPRTWPEVYREHLAYAAAADRLGFDGIWVPEHHCVPSGYNPAPFVALTAVAMATERCWIGTQPLLLPLYNPVLVAEQAAVLDVISGGRLILGVGAGYRAGDFEALGMDRRERAQRTDEGLTILERLFAAHEPIDFAGRFYQIKGAQLHPGPVQPKGPEIQLATRSAAAIQRAARHGVSVNMGLREAVPMYGPMLAEAARAAGHDPAGVGVSLASIGYLGASEEAARARAEPYMQWDAREYLAWEDRPDEPQLAEARRAAAKTLTGFHTPDKWLASLMEDMNSVMAAGLRPDWINLSMWPPGMPLEEAIEGLERFAATVLPHVPRQDRGPTERVTWRTD